MATAGKSQTPVVPTCSPATPVTCGSYRAIPARSTSVTGMPFARPRSASAASRGSSSVPVATISLPVTSCGTPCSRQNATSSPAPATAYRALYEPGR